MFIILMLSKQSNSSLSVIWIKFRHVKIINEVNKFKFVNRSKCSTNFLLKKLLENGLQKC